MRTIIAAIALVSALTACGRGDAGAPETDTPADANVGAAPAASGPVSASASAAKASTTLAGSAARPKTLKGRSRELVSPDHSSMVFLYYDLAGITPPIDTWVEYDSRVQNARPPDKDAERATVRAELEAGAAAVRGVGALRLSMAAGLSDYDPTYSEFTVRAFAPSSVVEFQAFRQKVAVKFGNGRDAQLWRVEASESRAIRDRIGYGGAYVEAFVVITGVEPAPNGGALIVDVVEYELRHTGSKHVIGRVRVAAR